MSDRLQPSLPIAETFDPAYLEYNGVLPLDIRDDRLRVAAVGDPDPEVLDDLASSYGHPVEVVAD